MVWFARVYCAIFFLLFLYVMLSGVGMDGKKLTRKIGPRGPR